MGKTNAQLGSEAAHEASQALYRISQEPGIDERHTEVLRLSRMVEKLGKRFDVEARRERERKDQQDTRLVDRLFAAAALHRLSCPQLTPREAVIQAHRMLAETEDFMEGR